MDQYGTGHSALQEVNILGLVMSITFVLLLLPLAFFFWTRRNHPYIKIRSLLFLFISLVLGSFTAPLSYAIFYAAYPRISCVFLFWGQFFLYQFYAFPLLIRCWIFVYMFRTTKHRARAAKRRDDRESKIISIATKWKRGAGAWLAKNKWLATDKFLFKLWVAGFIFHLLAPALIQITHGRIVGEFAEQGDYCASAPGNFIVTVCIGVVYIIFVFFFVYVLKTAKDAYFLKQEFRAICISWLVFVLIWVIWLQADILKNSFPSFFWISMAAISNMLVSGYYVWFQVYLDERTKRKRDEEGVVFDGTLRQMLHRPAFKTRFYDFLKLQFCVENLLFWDAVREWKHGGHDYSVACQIYDQFIRSDAENQVNIGNKHVHPVTRFLKEVAVPCY
eukprot:TRINITY_DN7623_c0_g1_i3.p1 TRINITY_DN7623_c0_g1~~TRINITY_DN7623_c0_g1_i3.p1  ORF type:complete len:390 (-),score=61.81 TRINITY_DN7623_c0_g1_i3:195-1364(-)